MVLRVSRHSHIPDVSPETGGGTDGIHFEESSKNPVLQFDDGVHSVLTPSLLKDGGGNALRENNRLRMWLSSSAFGRTGLHTLHETTSADGTRWDKPSKPLLDHCYCPTVLKKDDGYQLWYFDVSRRPWVIRYATSVDGRKLPVDAIVAGREPDCRGLAAYGVVLAAVPHQVRAIDLEHAGIDYDLGFPRLADLQHGLIAHVPPQPQPPTNRPTARSRCWKSSMRTKRSCGPGTFRKKENCGLSTCGFKAPRRRA